MFDSLLLYSSLMSECAEHGCMVTGLVILYLVDSSEGKQLALNFDSSPVYETVFIHD